MATDGGVFGVIYMVVVVFAVTRIGIAAYDSLGHCRTVNYEFINRPFSSLRLANNVIELDANVHGHCCYY